MGDDSLEKSEKTPIAPVERAEATIHEPPVDKPVHPDATRLADTIGTSMPVLSAEGVMYMITGADPHPSEVSTPNQQELSDDVRDANSEKAYVPEVTDGLTKQEQQKLMQAIKRQIDNPIDMDDEDVQRMTEVFGISGSPVQMESELKGLSGSRAREYLRVVGDAMRQVQQEGKNIDLSEWPRIVRHELQHFDKARELGFSEDRMGFTASFFEQTDKKGEKILGYGVTFSSGGIFTGRVVDDAEVTLAPSDPSTKDLMVFLSSFRTNRASFLKEPIRTLKMARKFQKFAGVTLFQAARIFLKK